MAATNKKMKSPQEKSMQAIRTTRNKRNRIMRVARRRLENPNKSTKLTARERRRLKFSVEIVKVAAPETTAAPA